jgi:methylmalonyl-CoA mutase N-terminal domain/subunit
MNIETKKKIVVGLNEYISKETKAAPVLAIDPKIETEQKARLKKFKEARDKNKVASAVSELQKTAKEDRNLMPSIFSAVKNHVTLGEISEALVQVYGRFRP